MRYFFAALLFLIWLIFAPWIAKGYGDWHLPNPFSAPDGAALEAAFFYLLPLIAIVIAISTFRLKRLK